MKKTILLAAALLPLLLGCKSGENTLTVMSYNIRFETADDGDNAWPHRREAVAEMIRDVHPAVFGVQEALPGQLRYIGETCPEYRWVGVGRDDGVSEGEHMAVFYDTTRTTLVNWGTYWLSETPDVPSYGWDAACRRTATWTLMKDLASGRHFYFVNTHLDHVGTEARKNGLLLVVERIAEMNPEGWPMILLGDFNVHPDDPCLDSLRPLMTDAWESALSADPGVTYHGWGRHTEGTPIDYVFYKGFGSCRDIRRITRTYLDVPFVSDHYPVAATLEY